MKVTVLFLIPKKKENYMGRTDERTAEFLAKEAIFADVFNHGMFHGKCVIDPKKLVDLDTTSRHRDMRVKFRDVVKKYDNQMVCMILGIENQTHIHFAMPLRVMDYDLRSYEEQRRKIQEKHKKQKDLEGDEYLSGFSKTDHLIPVVTLVLYWGSEEWIAPRDLHDILQIPEALKEYSDLIANYPMHLLEINKIKNLETYSDELKRVFGFIKYQRDRNGLLNYIENNENLFQEVSVEEYQLIQEITHSEELENFVPSENEGGKIDMCEALKQLKEESIQEGEQNILIRMVEKKLVKGNTPAEIAEILEIPLQQVETIIAKLQK